MIVRGDCLDVLRTLPDCSVDAVVTDPPAGIAFMGKAWDGNKGGRDLWIAWLADRLAECLRVLKPGGHAIVWALPRTSGWTHRALEDAGFDIRHCVHHLFGSGFPKSLDVGKAIDRAAPATPAAHRWDGWGTALKPAAEHWWLARKPLDSIVAGNVTSWGTGALNIDGCRVEGKWTTWRRKDGTIADGIGASSPMPMDRDGDIGRQSAASEEHPLGRWPADVVLSHSPECEDGCPPGCAVGELDQQSGTLTSGKMSAGTVRANRDGWAGPMPETTGADTYGDSGGASRFFPSFRYQAKPSRREKSNWVGPPLMRWHGDGPPLMRWHKPPNRHPTVKPVDLMRWLIRMITPPGGVVLDPFAGSGSTLVAATLEGFASIGIEDDRAQIVQIEGRVRWAEHRLSSG